jgi:hypothetical protein
MRLCLAEGFWALTLPGAIAGLLALLGVLLGSRLQRSQSDRTLSRELQIKAAADFMAAIDEFTLAYAHSNRPRDIPLAETDREAMRFDGFMRLKSRAAAIAIVGPDELSRLAELALDLATEAAFSKTRSVEALLEVSDLGRSFSDEAKKLRPSA